MDLHRAFEILELDKTASLFEVKRAYRDLAFVWHPDRHTQNSRLAEKALNKMKELNAAYELLSKYYANSAASESGKKRSDRNSEFIVIKCKVCGASNRVQYLAGVIFRCGKCQNNLFSENHYADDEERILCADGECIGVIDPNGRCSACGKTLDEARFENARKTRNYEEIIRERQKKIKKKKIRNRVVIVSLAAAFILFFVYAIYQESVNTGKEKKEDDILSKKAINRQQQVMQPPPDDQVIAAFKEKAWWLTDYPRLNAALDKAGGSLSASYRTGLQGTSYVSVRLVRGERKSLILGLDLPPEATMSIDPNTGKAQSAKERASWLYRDHNLDGIPDDVFSNSISFRTEKGSFTTDGFMLIRDSADHPYFLINWTFFLAFSTNHFLYGKDSVSPPFGKETK